VPLAVFPKCYLDALLVQRSMSVEDWVDLVAEHLAVDGLELYTPLIEQRSDAELDALRRQIASRGLVMPMMCHSPDFTIPDPAGRQAEVERQRRAVTATARLGGRYCRVLSGQRRPGLDPDETVGWVADSIRAVLHHAERHGVVLTLENHYKDGAWRWSEFAQPTARFLQLVEAVGDSPYFAVNFDPSNTLIGGEDPLELLAQVAGRVATMHASDRYLEGGTLDDLRRCEAEPHTGYADLLRHGVIGQGLNDYDRIFTLLAGAGFQGWISIEDGDDPVHGLVHLQQSVTFLRAKMAQHGLR